MKKLIHHIEEALKINSRSKVKKSEPGYKEFIKEFSLNFNVLNQDQNKIFDYVKKWCDGYGYKEDDLICVVAPVYSHHMSLFNQYSDKFGDFLNCIDLCYDDEILSPAPNFIRVSVSEDFIILKFSKVLHRSIFISTENFVKDVKKYSK